MQLPYCFPHSLKTALSGNQMKCYSVMVQCSIVFWLCKLAFVFHFLYLPDFFQNWQPLHLRTAVVSAVLPCLDQA